MAEPLPRHWRSVSGGVAFHRCDKYYNTYFYKGIDHRWYAPGLMAFLNPTEAMKVIDEQIPVECACTPMEILAHEIQQAKEFDV